MLQTHTHLESNRKSGLGVPLWPLLLSFSPLGPRHHLFFEPANVVPPPGPCTYCSLCLESGSLRIHMAASLFIQGPSSARSSLTTSSKPAPPQDPLLLLCLYPTFKKFFGHSTYLAWNDIACLFTYLSLCCHSPEMSNLQSQKHCQVHSYSTSA